MKLDERITELRSQYDVVAVIDLDPWHDVHEYDKKSWMRQILGLVHQDSYLDNQRIVFTISQGDVYTDNDSLAGQLLTQFQRRLNEIDISNFFVIVLTNDVSMRDSYRANFKELSKDNTSYN